MASSNDIAVLDPTATVEKLKNIVSKVALNRRHFMAALGVAGIAAGTRLGSGPVARAQQPTPNGFAQIDVLNFLLNVKYLKATFYSYVTQGADLPGSSYAILSSGQVYNAPGKITFTGTNAAQIADMFNEMYYDELNQLIDLRNFLGVAAVPRATMNLLGNSVANATYVTPSGTVISTGAQAIGQARMLEDVSVTAFAGALSYLTGTNLAIAAQILAVDGCHAAALRLATIQTGAAYQGTLYQSNFQIGTNTSTPNTLYAILTSTAAVVGDIITAPGLIPAGSVITAINTKASVTPTGFVTSGSKNITAVSSTSGILVGQPITGTGVPANTYVASVGTTSPYTVAISNAVTATPAAVAPTGYITAGTSSITGVSSVSGLVVGQPITTSTTAIAGQVLGVIPANTTISAASGTTITMSANASATGSISFVGILTSGSTTLTPVSSTVGLAVGQPLTGVGIPASPATTITAIGTNITMSAKATASSTFPTQATFYGILTSGSPTITVVQSAAGVLGIAGLGLVVGQPLTGANITPGTTITAIAANTVTMSANPTAASTVTPTGTVTSGSPIITNVTSVAGVIAGQAITGTGIPSSTTVSSFGTTVPYSITMSKNATATLPPITISGVTTIGSNTITNAWGVGASGTTVFTGLVAGQPLNGVGIPSGATITSWGTVYPYSITMSQPATATLTPVSFTAITTSGSPTLTDVWNVTGLSTGQALTGTGIPANTLISSIVGSTAPYSITMVSATTGAAANASLTVASLSTITTGEIITFPAEATLTIPALQPVINGGQVLTSPTVSTVSSPANETLTIGQGTITISEAAIVTGTGTATIATPDPYEVVPVDPGTAPLAAAGPALDTSSSPPVYQGFFATAGTTNATSSTPAGFAYARTFSQVLAVLYGGTATGTYEGAFYPEGVSCNINVV